MSAATKIAIFWSSASLQASCAHRCVVRGFSVGSRARHIEEHPVENLLVVVKEPGSGVTQGKLRHRYIHHVRITVALVSLALDKELCEAKKNMSEIFSPVRVSGMIDRGGHCESLVNRVEVCIVCMSLRC